MQNIRSKLLTLMLACSLAAGAQSPDAITDYIATYQNIAISEMQRTGVPAAIKLAQGIHETTAGTSELVKKSNNHFGIKCKADWTGEKVSHTDDAPHECFRKYDDPFQSYRDHSDFLKSSSRYASLFKLDPQDYEAWAYGLKKAGYATNPKYAQIIIRLIETYQLQDYTLIALGKMPPKEEQLAKTVNEENKDAAVSATSVEVVTAEKNVEEKPHYPSGEFKIHDTRVVFVKSGTSLLSIAQQYDIPLAKIIEFNEMIVSDILLKDELIYLQRKRKTGNNEFHIVRQGETLRDIAQEEAIRMESLLEYNHLQSGMQPAAGEQLYLKSKAPGMPRLAKNELASAGR